MLLNNPKTAQATIAGKPISIETGRLAKQANGSIQLTCGNTVLLATATMSKEPKEGIDFFPLTVEVVEKMYAAGKIPGGFFKREARPSTDATLTARLIDRPLRPSFPKGFVNDVQIVVTILSYDPEVALEPLSIIAASAAVSVSDIPFNGPVGGVVVGYKNGQYLFNPSPEELESGDLNIVVAGTESAILMVEAGAKEVSEEVVLGAITQGHEYIKQSIALQKDLANQAGKTKKEFAVAEVNTELVQKIESIIGTQIEDNMTSANKQEVDDFLTELEKKVLEACLNEDASNKSEVSAVYNKVKKAHIRKAIITRKLRPDGRALNEIRAIESETSVLPSAHGSALFTRGETQSLGVVTLGTSADEQMIDGLGDKENKNYFFHYNFPPFSVGEVGFVGRVSRRELGHGALAERAIAGILPESDEFPYTIRLVSEILESNGSSSMASVCSGCLSLMDCGVPIKNPVSGIAMGLLIENDDYTILSDIQGLEDHYGDMDFKVAGSEKGITALQLDIKVAGLSEKILTEALAQAKEGRLFILSKMTEVLAQPRAELSKTAPKMENIKINPEKVGLVIGPGGKMIRKIEEESGATVHISDGSTGEVNIAAKSSESLEKAKKLILQLVKDIEVDDVYEGKIVKTTNFGAFVELVPGKEGLLHISTLSDKRIDHADDAVEVGQIISVRVKNIDNQNRVSLVPVK